MLSKLLKHEFRATGRTMLPVYAAVVVLAVLGNLSIRVIDRSVHTLVTIFCGLIIAAFIIGIIAAGIITLVMMIKRFYTNYLKDEGYLMHTLPVSVHELVWSKMIVSVVWFAATAVVICLVILLTALIQTGTSLAQFFAGFPSWAEIKAALAEAGIRSGDLWVIGLETLLAIIVGGLFTCLHFYAAMSLGHMFSKDKILLSIVFFVPDAYIASWREDVILLLDVLDADGSTKALLILQFALSERVERLGNLCDVLVGELAQAAAHHGAHLTGINEQRLALAVALLADDP